jgi:hypothetical protein
MSKSLLNLLVQISKALVNSKIKILIQKIFLLHFRPDYPYRPTWPLAQPAPLAPLFPQAEPQPTWPLSRSAHVCRCRISPKTFSSLIHAFRSQCLLSIPSLMHGPRLSAPFSPLRHLLLTSGCHRAITAPITPPLTPLQTEL